LRIDFNIAIESWATCTLFFDNTRDWSVFRGVAFRYQADAPTRFFDFTLHSGTIDEPTSYQYNVESVTGSENALIPIDLTWNQILGVDWEGDARNPIDPGQITGVSFGFSAYEGTSNSGAIWIDDLHLIGDETETEMEEALTESQPITGEAQTNEGQVQPETEYETTSKGAGNLCPGSMALVGLAFAGIFFKASVSSRWRRSS